jgi:hypothetical protein
MADWMSGRTPVFAFRKCAPFNRPRQFEGSIDQCERENGTGEGEILDAGSHDQLMPQSRQ